MQSNYSRVSASAEERQIRRARNRLIYTATGTRLILQATNSQYSNFSSSAGCPGTAGSRYALQRIAAPLHWPNVSAWPTAMFFEDENVLPSITLNFEDHLHQLQRSVGGSSGTLAIRCARLLPVVQLGDTSACSDSTALSFALHLQALD